MVNPIYIFVIALGIAFLLTLFDKISRTVSLLIFFAALLAMTIIPAFWFSAFLNGAKTLTIYTAGFKPPFSINLQFGLIESFFVLMSNLVGLLAAFYLLKKLKENSDREKSKSANFEKAKPKKEKSSVKIEDNSGKPEETKVEEKKKWRFKIN